MLKKLLLTGLLLLPLSTFAASVPWDRPSVGKIQPLFQLDTVFANIFTGTSTTATSSFPLLQATTRFLGAGLTDCDAANNALTWDISTWRFGCNTISASGSGTISTSTNAVIGNLLYFTGASTVGNVATTSVTCTGSTTCSPFTVIGGSPITISSSVGSSFSYPFNTLTTFGTTTFSTTTALWLQAPLYASSTATSTFNGGINLTGGDCFAISGTCLQTFIQNATAFKSAVIYSSTTTLPSYVYANGASGVGATITEVGNGALYIDGNNPTLGQRVLIKDEAGGNAPNNGVYTVTVTGSAIASFVLTRATDFNSSVDVYAGVTVPVLSGTANAGTAWVQTTTGVVIIGTSNIVFSESSSASGGVSSIKQTYGSGQTGAITLATSSATSFNGLTINNTITNSGGTFTIPPNSISGLLGWGGGGTNATTFSPNSIITSNLSTLTATSADPLYIGSFLATSTTATSSVAGNLRVFGNLQVDGGFFSPAKIVSSGNVTINGTLTATGNTTLATSLNGALSAASGLVSAGTLSIANGGTNNTAYATNSLLAFDGSKFVATTTSPLTIGSLISTTTATSTFAGGITISGGALGIGTTTPGQTSTLGVNGKLFVSNGLAVNALGTATSTFMGDIKLLGKLDVSTIDPVYTIGGIKYATYGASTVGVKEEVVQKVYLTTKNESGEYEYAIDFPTLPTGSDFWLFYQITEWGLGWKDLIVSLTPGFKGQTYYENDYTNHRLLIKGSAPGEVSVRLIANRYDSAKWPNLRPDQQDSFTHFKLDVKQ